jgi:hypothetical protein
MIKRTTWIHIGEIYVYNTFWCHLFHFVFDLQIGKFWRHVFNNIHFYVIKKMDVKKITHTQ